MLADTSHTAQQYPNTLSVDVLNRILTVLAEQGKTRRTNLAGKTGLNYLVCIRYINFMRTLGWLEVVADDDDSEFVQTTQMGKRVGDALSSFLEGRDPDKIVYPESAELMYPMRPQKEKVRPEALVGSDVETSRSKDAPGRLKNAKIMLIDDEPDVALTYKSFLTSEGYTVDAFREPEKAVEHFISSRPLHYDLVITDIRMREMNGLRLFQCLKNIDPSIRVIFVTALDAAEELVSVVSPGPVQILKKPVDKELFSRTVKSALLS